MKRLNQLSTIAETTLSGLQADESLKYRILHAAKEPQKTFRLQWRWAIPALCCLLAMAVLLPSMLGTPALKSPISQPAGAPATTAPLLAQGGIVQGSITRTGSDMGHSLWEGKNSNFPLLGVNGRYYRLLSTPSTLSDDLLQDGLGYVNEFSNEPALSGTAGIVSNVCSLDTLVYRVAGMGDAMVAAEVNGSLRLFQRVSFNGMSIQGSEGLRQTLCPNGTITTMTLSGVGTVSGDACARLLNTLFANATYEGSGSIKSELLLVMETSTGLMLQMAVSHDSLGACGVWSCPEFFSAFQAAVQ